MMCDRRGSCSQRFYAGSESISRVLSTTTTSCCYMRGLIRVRCDPPTIFLFALPWERDETRMRTRLRSHTRRRRRRHRINNFLFLDPVCGSKRGKAEEQKAIGPVALLITFSHTVPVPPPPLLPLPPLLSSSHRDENTTARTGRIAV